MGIDECQGISVQSLARRASERSSAAELFNINEFYFNHSGHDD